MDLEHREAIGEEAGRLIAERIERENPDLVRDLRSTMDALIRKHHKPWYVRLYEQAKNFFYRGSNRT